MKGGIVEYDLPHNSHRLFDVTLGDDEIEALVTHNPKSVKSWINNTLILNEARLHRLIVGLDVEWTPEFIDDSDHSVAVLQLCVGKSCLIYQILLSPSIPRKLREFLRNPSFTFVGVGVEADAEKLWNDYSLDVRNTKDLRFWAAKELGRKELRRAGLKTLVEEVCGEEVDKSKCVTCSKWDRQVLTRNQVMYACFDGYFSFEIGRRLSAWY